MQEQGKDVEMPLGSKKRVQDVDISFESGEQPKNVYEKRQATKIKRQYREMTLEKGFEG